MLIAGLVFLALCTLTLCSGQELEKPWRTDDARLAAYEPGLRSGAGEPAADDLPALRWQARQRRLAQRLGQQRAGQRAAAAGYKQATMPGAGDPPRGLQPPLDQAA